LGVHSLPDLHKNLSGSSIVPKKVKKMSTKIKQFKSGWDALNNLDNEKKSQNNYMTNGHCKNCNKSIMKWNNQWWHKDNWYHWGNPDYITNCSKPEPTKE